MNHFKSLSDSSTSESEEDGRRHQYKVPNIDTRNPRKRELSTDDTEDEHADILIALKKAKNDVFKNPAKYVERDLSDSESDDKMSSMNSPFKPAISMPTTDIMNVNYGVGMKLMEKMGFKHGVGLGKYEQGRTDIVHASSQRGRRGLGLQLKGLEPSDTADWEAGTDKISIREPIEWIPPCTSQLPRISELRDWIFEGEKKETLEGETEFCDPEVLSNVLTYKSVFDLLESDEMMKARNRANPFESIKNGMFLNRAAMKMANMDAAFDFMFTEPKTLTGEPAVMPDELLYFADVCAGPGGFSEYVLFRKKWESKGFGMTLKDLHDFKLEDFLAGPPETFEPHYGANGDGDIYTPANLREFKKFVISNTDNKGVHFVMADGGFSVEGRENEQEILSKRLYLCQFLCALSILRTDGHFVCKLFDIFTPFSVGLVYLMYQAFEKVCIFKPNTSRPANSERYIVCKWLKPDIKDICDYMYEINGILDKNSSSTCNTDVNEVVPLHVLKNDEAFFDYIVKSNNLLGATQIVHLDKVRIFAKNPALVEDRSAETRTKCLKLWKVPDKARAAKIRPEPKDKYTELMQGDSLSDVKNQPIMLDENSIQRFKSIFEIQCVVCGDGHVDKATMFLGLGRSNIYRLEMKTNTWHKIEGTLELPANTLFFGELVSELKGEGRGQRKITCLHIIDAVCLGGIDIRKKNYATRMKLSEKLAKAVSKPSRPDYMPLRVKKIYELKNVEEIFDNLSLRLVKSCPVPRLCYDLVDGRHVIPSGLLLFRTVKEPWLIAYSKGQQRPYFFDKKRNKSSYEHVPEASADFMTCFRSRALWAWGSGVHLIPDQDFDDSKKTLIHSHTIIAFVQRQLNRIMGNPS